ncbi:hypothetical protein [Roseiflexus sp.]|uniref:hypothetical protein n=1 Tax=Roseiflexus sp. TaxID=2562120 RepID=UPI00258EA746|nr:hypothetical protein [Roseiflexus sp.]
MPLQSAGSPCFPSCPDEVLHEALMVMANDVLLRRDTRDTLLSPSLIATDRTSFSAP